MVDRRRRREVGEAKLLNNPYSLIGC